MEDNLKNGLKTRGQRDAMRNYSVFLPSIPINANNDQVWISSGLSLDGLKKQRDEAGKRMETYYQQIIDAKNHLDRLDVELQEEWDKTPSSAEEGEVDVELKISKAAKRRREKSRVQHLHALRLYQAHRYVHELTTKLLRDATITLCKSCKKLQDFWRGKRPDQSYVDHREQNQQEKVMNRSARRQQPENGNEPTITKLAHSRWISDGQTTNNTICFKLTTSLHGLQEQMTEAIEAKDNYFDAMAVEEERFKDAAEKVVNLLHVRAAEAEKTKKRHNKVLKKAMMNRSWRRACLSDAIHLHKIHLDVFDLTEKLVLDAQQLFGTSDFKKVAVGVAKYLNDQHESSVDSESSIEPENSPNNLSKLRDVCPEHVHVWLLPGFKSPFTTEEVEELEEWTGRGFFHEGATDRQVEEDPKNKRRNVFLKVADVIKNCVSSDSYIEKFGRKGMEMMEELVEKRSVLLPDTSSDSGVIENSGDADYSEQPDDSAIIENTVCSINDTTRSDVLQEMDLSSSDEDQTDNLSNSKDDDKTDESDDSDGYLQRTRTTTKGSKQLQEADAYPEVFGFPESPQNPTETWNKASTSSAPFPSSFSGMSMPFTSTSSASSTSGIKELRKRRLEPWDPLEHCQQISRK